MVRALDPRPVCLLLTGLLAACASAPPRGRVVRLRAEAGGEKEALKSPLMPSPGLYAVSQGEGSLLAVPSSPEEAAVFHFSLGQAYSLDNDPQRAMESYRATLAYDPKSALVRARLAAELVKVGSFAEARQLCEEAVRLDPRYVDSYLLLAGIQVAAKEYGKAIETYGRALKMEPGNRDALLYMGVTLAEVGRVEEGIGRLEKLVRLKDSSESSIDQGVAYYYLAKVYEQAGQRNKAAEAYASALKKRPGFSKAALALSDIHIAQRNVRKAYAVLEEAFAEGRGADLAERLAERHLEGQDYKGAVPYLETLVEEDPTNENMKLRLALVYWQVRWLDKAFFLFSDLHSRYPGSSEIAYYLGELELDRGGSESALSYYAKVSPDYAKYDQMASRVAYVYRQQKRLADAESFLLGAIGRRPDLVSLYPVLAAVYEDGGKLKEARLVLEKGERLFPEDENVLYYLGFLLDRLGEKDKALARMEKLLTVNPDNANALNFVGYTLVEKGERMEKAAAYLERALRLKPEDAFILDSYGWLLYRLGRRQEAMKKLEKAFTAKPDEGVIAEHLADLYVALNLPRKAVAVYEQALKGGGGDKEFVARVQTKLANIRGTLAAAGSALPPSFAPSRDAEARESSSSARSPASSERR